jgi:uncharacterized metal-binding protein YceD (DUF177 family)
MKREDLLDLNEALQFPGKKLEFTFVTELQQEEDIDLLTPVEGWLEAVSTGNVLLVKAEFKTSLVLECSRCTHPLEQELTFVMEDEFMVEGIPSSWSHEGFAKVVFDEPEKLFEGNGLYRDRYVRQGLLVNLPLQPLCSGGWDDPCPFAANRPTLTSTSDQGPLKGLSRFLETPEGRE